MTVPIDIKVKCAVCGKESIQTVLASTSAFGSPDLDLRPPEPARSSMFGWIQVCPHCGYAAPDLSEFIPGAEEVVKSKEYQELINETEFPELSFPELENAFACYSLIQENAHNYSEAGWAQVHAAWACDDKGLKERAKNHREKAIELFEKAKEQDMKFSEDELSEYALLIDLYRRSGKLAVARQLIEEALGKGPKGTILKVLKFEKLLIERGDTEVHTIEEAISALTD